MRPSIHHLELWTSDFALSSPPLDWLLTQLGWDRATVPGWEDGTIWNAPDGTYLVLEQSPALTGALDRMRAGMNHLALVVPERATLDSVRADAPAHGWTELFADRYPHAGGPDSTALYLENQEGFEVELVVVTGVSDHPQPDVRSEA